MQELQAFELSSSTDKHFSFLLLKQASYEVTFTVSLNRYKHSEGIHLVLGPVTFAHVQEPRFLPGLCCSRRRNVHMSEPPLHALAFQCPHVLQFMKSIEGHLVGRTFYTLAHP